MLNKFNKVLNSNYYEISTKKHNTIIKYNTYGADAKTSKKDFKKHLKIKLKNDLQFKKKIRDDRLKCIII